MTDPVKPADVAAWMARQVEDEGRELDQIDAVDEIEKHFGAEFVYENDNGNHAIDKRVLKTFNETTKDTVVWDPYGKFWRKRVEGDAPGRSQR